MWPIMFGLLLCLATSSVATITIVDPSDYADLSADAADNSLTADWDYSPLSYQEIAITGPYYYNDSQTTLGHETLTASGNDTSVLVITEDSDVDVSYTTIIKYGYSTDLYQSSFYGVNAAVNVANASIASFDHVNVTSHNGAASIYGYGNDTYVYVNNSDLYSSGPLSHGLYAAGYGTIIGRNVRHYSGAYRSSSYAGDSPKGYIYVYDSESHTAGLGSAVFYAQGIIHAEHVIGYTENAPVLFVDGATVSISHSDLTAGLLAGMVTFSSGTRQSGSTINLIDTRLTVLPETAAGLWFGNVIATSTLTGVEINTTSGVLVAANYSQVTQAFDHLAGYEANSDLEPAEATLDVYESSLSGDLVAYNGSSISWSLYSYSSWTGAAYSGYGTSYFAVLLDKTSSWTLTADTTLQNFTNSVTNLSNIDSAGYNIYYDSSSSANKWLNNATISLSGGGSISPI
ncbi:hypothetical protein UCRPC4_g06720 [Phaeomoniella chlamydospora]|uniref:Uncharacterized protein n=1 Tax=Phaeomoniella chlamydospora TaxID=158046 RepID=A0A0G2DUW8_PHACM|nr:hypothetical protein UCRPC4_g06720 [Phaeomoniella chlamydospora]